jgi:hypothetical protein
MKVMYNFYAMQTAKGNIYTFTNYRNTRCVPEKYKIMIMSALMSF